MSKELLMGQECGINKAPSLMHLTSLNKNLMDTELALDLIHCLAVVVGLELSGDLRWVASDVVSSQH